MTDTQKTSTVRAVKNLNDDTVFIYRASLSEGGTYEVSVERYLDNVLTEASGMHTSISNDTVIDKLLLEMCKGALEPCHLKDIIEDMEYLAS